MTPEFAEAVAPVVRWALENGWEHDVYPSHYRCDEVRVVADETGWVLVNDFNDAGFTRGLARFRGDSPQQAIDVLAALGVLPARFSSQWREGYGQGRDDEAQSLDIRDAVRANLAAVFMTPDALPDFVDGHPIGTRSHA